MHTLLLQLNALCVHWCKYYSKTGGDVYARGDVETSKQKQEKRKRFKLRMDLLKTQYEHKDTVVEMLSACL